ncbi:MAG: hypothetical protein AB1696_02685 [Planctomycetota bacterium]
MVRSTVWCGMGLWIWLALWCISAATSFAQTNVIPFGDLESGARGKRPPQFWHRGGGDYLSAYPDWEITDETAASGKWSATTTTTRELVMCGEGGSGPVAGSVSLKAAKAGTKARIRLSGWNRLNRSDETREVTVGPEWARFELEAKSDGGPMELAVASIEAGVRLWADDFRIAAKPLSDQLGDMKIIRPKPLDLNRIETYDGKGQDASGKVALHVNIPADCVELPYVSGGVPFPRGRLFRAECVRVLDAAGVEVPMQVNVLARWRADQSIKVLLVTVPRPGMSADFTLEFGPAVKHMAISGHWGIARTGIPVANSPVPSTPALASGDGQPTGQFSWRRTVDRFGPLTAIVTEEGEYALPDGKRLGRWVRRMQLWRGSRRALVSHCWINDEGGGSIPIQSAWCDIGYRRPLPAAERTTQVAYDGRFVVPKDDVVRPPTGEAAEPTRHDGLFDGRLAIRDFWQNHPCAVETTKDGYRIWLWPETVRGVLIPQGFARQWEFLISNKEEPLTKSFQTTAMPILSADPEWMCASGVFEFLLPPDPEAFPVFEKRVGSIPTLGGFAWEQKEARNLFGLFNYGDAPGDGGWSNLESMADHELFLHWMRTRSREHFDMARLAAEHYRDMDIHHGAGFCHTHCNNHVGSGEGWSHAWVQGVRDLYFLLGDLRALEVLQEVGERLLTKEVGWTSGRDWTRPIDDLVDIAGATGDKRFLDCAKRHITELGRRQLPEHAVCGAERTSWYEDRYPAGCAFTWYGCQAMAKLHLETGDDEVLNILKREIDLSLDVQTKSLRCNAILPGEKIGEDRQAEVLANPFALGRGSTLFPPLGYLADATGERRYLDLGMKILAHYMLNLRSGSDASATSYATVFLHYAKRAGVGAKEEAAAFHRARDFSFEQWPTTVVNGGFEEDSFKGWDAKKAPGQNEFYDKLIRVGHALDEQVKHSGARSLRLRSDNPGRTAKVDQRVALKPMTRWRIDLWMRAGEGAQPVASLSLREYDEDRGSGVAFHPEGEPADGWQKIAAEFTTVTRTVATVALSQGGKGDVWFDDVVLTEIGPAYSLLSDNGGGRDWRKPAYPGLNVETGGTYQADEPMAGDLKTEGKPIPFTQGCLTDGVSRYDYRQKPLGSYAYWAKRPKGSIAFDLGRPYRIRQVHVNVTQGGTKGHGTRRIELHEGGADGKLLGAIEPAVDGWNRFDGLDLMAQHLTLVLVTREGATYTTLSEVEIWGERAP